MSFEEMQQIAYEMTSQGIPLNLDRYYRGLEDAIDRMADGDAVKLTNLQEKFSNLIQLEGSLLRPTWRVVRRGRDALPRETQLLDWTSSGPNTYGLPTEVLRGVEGWRLIIHQAEMYLLAQLAGHQEWIDHYLAGGDLWDKVQEGLKQEGPIQPNDKKAFLILTCNRHARHNDKFPWLTEAMERYEKLAPSEVKTPTGTQVPADNIRHRLWMAAMWWGKDLLRDGILEGYRGCGRAPYLIHHDGAIIHKDLIHAYSPALARNGLRVILMDGVTGYRTPPREHSTLAPRRRQTRFDIIDGL